MQKYLVVIALMGMLAVAGASAFSGNEQPDKLPMLAHLKVGQSVRLERALSGGYNVNILNDRYLKSFERAEPKHPVATKIVGFGRDFIVVSNHPDLKQFISAQAIHMITEMSDAYGAPAEDSKKAGDK